MTYFCVELSLQVNADLIPKVASNLGLTELVKGVEAAGLKDMLVSPGEDLNGT